MFKFSEIADQFDDHLSGQLYWHNDFVNHFLPEIASVYMSQFSTVYDFGAATGNVELALSDMIQDRKIRFFPVEQCSQMINLYKGDKYNILHGDITHITMENFSFATSILTLCFVHPSKRENFLNEVKSKCLKGGAFLLLEKMKSKRGYLGSALNRVTWRNKMENGESIENIVDKELSLSGVQYPLSESELEGFELVWAYGDFRAYVWTNEF